MSEVVIASEEVFANSPKNLPKSKNVNSVHGRRRLVENWNSTDACTLCVCYNRKQKLHVDCTVAPVMVTSLPENIPVNTSRLWLQGQGLTDIGITNILPPLPQLRELFLNGNSDLTNLSIDAFKNVRNLRTLLLHYTAITELPDGIFDGMVNLRNLWVNNAAVSSVGPNVFRGLTKLETLYLHGNNISEFAEGQFYGLPNILELDITRQIGNKILDPTCCDFCGVNPAAVKFNHANTSTLVAIGDGAKVPELRCGIYIFSIFLLYTFIYNEYLCRLRAKSILPIGKSQPHDE